MDELDQECRDALDAIRSGRMSLDEFICWVCDHCAEAFIEGKQSLEQTPSGNQSGAAV